MITNQETASSNLAGATIANEGIMSIEDHELLSLPFIKRVYNPNEKVGYKRFKIVETNYGFDYKIRGDICSPIMRFRKNGYNFKGRKGPVDFQVVLDTVPEEYIAFLIFCQEVFDYEESENW